MASFNPYQPPVADIHPVEGAHVEGVVPPPTRLARVVVGGLALTGLVALIAIVGDLGQIALLGRGATEGIEMAEAEANDSRMMAISIAYGVSFVGTAIAFAMWLARANRTARSLAPHLVSNTPTWTVAWFFVPFANFYKPYTAVKELWVASSSHDPTYGGETPSRFPLWWAAWLATTAIGRFATQMANKAGSDIDALISATQFELAADVLRIAVAVAAASVVLAISGAQERAYRAPTR